MSAQLYLTAKDKAAGQLLRYFPQVVRQPYQTVRFICVGLGTAAITLVALGINLATLVLMGWIILGCLFYASRRFESALYLFAFAQPFEQIFFIWGGSRFNTLSYLAMAIALLGFLRSGQRASWHRLTGTEVLAAVWVLWGVITLYWTADVENGSVECVTNAGGITVLYLYSRGLRSEKDVLYCLQHFMAGTLIASGLLFAYYDPSSAFVYRADGQMIQSAFALGTGVAPAEFARAGLVSLMGALIVWELEKRRNRKRIALALAAFFGIVVVLTLIRTVIFAQAIALLTWAVSGKEMQKSRKIVQIGIFLSIIGVSAWLVNPHAVEYRFNMSVEKYLSGNLDQFTAGRANIWSVAWELFQDHPLQGIGLGAFPLEYSLQTGDFPRGDHSVYVQMFTETGVVGGVIFIMLLAKLGQNAYMLRQWRGLTFPLWIAFVGIFVSQGLGRAKEFWIASALTLFLVQHAKRARASKEFKPIPVGTTRGLAPSLDKIPAV